MSVFFRHPCFHWRPRFLIRLSSLPAGKSLPIPHLVPRTQIKGRVMNSKNPVAEETLGLRPWTTRIALRSRPSKQQRNRPSGENRPGLQFGSRYEHPFHNIVRQRGCLPAYRRVHGTPRETLWFLTMVKVWGANVSWLRCQRCSRASTSNMFRNGRRRRAARMSRIR